MARTTDARLAGYETTFITRSELADDQLKALQEKLNGIVAQYGGELVLSEDWGKRKLAYPITKESRGQYTYMVYSGKGDIVHEMERNLRLHDHVLRFLTVNLATEFDAEHFRKQRADYHAAAKRREEEREARREERMAERRGYSEDRGDRGYDRGDRGDRYGSEEREVPGAVEETSEE
jgi:small subunit ribosomal protein S6